MATTQVSIGISGHHAKPCKIVSALTHDVHVSPLVGGFPSPHLQRSWAGFAR